MSPRPYDLTMREQGPDRFRADGPEVPTPNPGPSPQYELTVEQSRELDRRATNEFGIPSIVLMENAAIGLFQHAMRLIENQPSPSVLICCGSGNNGGDGFALARHMHNAMIPVRVIYTQSPDRYKGDAAINLDIIQRMGIEIHDARSLLNNRSDSTPTLIVDALFGTGLSRAIDGELGELIDWINQTKQRWGARVLAVDVPSGLNAQTGHPMGDVVIVADRTVTFAALKVGFRSIDAQPFLGQVDVAPIGVPVALIHSLGCRVNQPHDRE